MNGVIVIVFKYVWTALKIKKLILISDMLKNMHPAEYDMNSIHNLLTEAYKRFQIMAENC